MEFAGAVGAAFRRAGDFQGRSSRSEYWYFFLLNFLVQVCATALAYTEAAPWSTAVAGLWFLAAIVPGISVFIRRLRDAGYSPWMSLFILAGPIGAMVFLVLLCQPSKGATSTGDSPDNLHAYANVLSDDQRHKSAFLLLACIMSTLIIVIGSITYASAQAARRETAAEESASRAVAAASSRAAAAASASASADAARRAAANAEASRLDQIARDQQAAASKAAAATASAAAVARTDLLAKGWSDGPDGVFYQWLPSDQIKCREYTRCSQLKVTTPMGCPNGVSVEVSELTKGTVTGSGSAYSPGFVAGQNALVTLTSYDANMDQFVLKKMVCH